VWRSTCSPQQVTDKVWPLTDSQRKGRQSAREVCSLLQVTGSLVSVIRHL
jgi:hypothetical protein